MSCADVDPDYNSQSVFCQVSVLTEQTWLQRGHYNQQIEAKKAARSHIPAQFIAPIMTMLLLQLQVNNK